MNLTAQGKLLAEKVRTMVADEKMIRSLLRAESENTRPALWCHADDWGVYPATALEQLSR